MGRFHTGPFTVGISAASAANNFLARTSGLDGKHQNAYSALLTGLTADGFFDANANSTLLDALYVFATADSTTAKLNLIAPSYTCTYHGTPAEGTQFAADNGYTGDGSTVYLDTGFPIGTGGHVLSPGSVSMGVYMTTAWSVGAGQQSPIGTDNFTGDYLNMTASGAAFTATINTLTALTAGHAPQGNKGLFSATMLGPPSTAPTRTIYTFNGSFQGADGTTTSGLNFNLDQQANIFILAIGFTPAAAFFCSNQVGAAFFGGNLTGTQMTALATRLNTWMATFGINAW